jgi:hypothetical protein
MRAQQRARQSGRMDEITNERRIATALAVAGTAGLIWLTALVYVIAAWSMA